MRLCQHCDHFVEPNPDAETDASLAKFLHMDDGDQEYDHDAEPSTDTDRPDLLRLYPDGKIGPNSMFHSRRGKRDSVGLNTE